MLDDFDVLEVEAGLQQIVGGEALQLRLKGLTEGPNVPCLFAP